MAPEILSAFLRGTATGREASRPSSAEPSDSTAAQITAEAGPPPAAATTAVSTAVMWTTGSGAPLLRTGQAGWPSHCGAEVVRASARRNSGAATGATIAGTGLSTGAAVVAAAASPELTRSTTSWARCCSAPGSGLQVLRSREAVAGRARAMRQRHASGEMKFQDSSKLRARRSRQESRLRRAANCRGSGGRCLELKRSQIRMAWLLASKGLSKCCNLHNEVLLSKVTFKA
mmetsp:Transcript_3635/g.8582  ORF Transcript_3635/g.8582 Transcript_3635/m.8582 type:complete len:231 (+) Transcript_3635:259-951(+)